jgi:predicted lipid-binding transport protein (Tim44 family)
MEETDLKGLIAGLTDFSFSEFITTRIVKILYILCVVLAGLTGLGIFVAALREGFIGALVGLLLGGLAFLVYVLFARVSLEVLIVVFRIAENTRDLRMMMAEQGAAALEPSPAGAAAEPESTPEPAEAQQEPTPAEPQASVTGPAPEEVAEETAEEDDDDELEFELQ